LPGGLQVQVWSGNGVVATSSQGSAQFATQGETVSWTQRLSLGGGSITYDIDNGQSTTWGVFGQDAKLRVSLPAGSNSLAGYSPQYSVKKSGASWQSNRVSGLTLLRVRYYANGQ